MKVLIKRVHAVDNGVREDSLRLQLKKKLYVKKRLIKTEKQSFPF